ncbi:PfkB family carbohydrate kinase [Cytobacillus sp. Bac17]|uniref:Carbohydrate kinase PfkB domain-containing protein n=2 Tax=Cytobacillus oceanisediminis TaxID=665099 RepID=A0ABX3CNT4_9BACI|nr:PfkB family carbohydrate kinase [Cytobacillus sp. Bac17]OHX44835.1 hypothetical protein BBV17_24540 [Cytobacillus oceanisediminis]
MKIQGVKNKTSRFPEVGETNIGKACKQFPGGKGANQAVAAARLGGDVSFIDASVMMFLPRS